MPSLMEKSSAVADSKFSKKKDESSQGPSETVPVPESLSQQLQNIFENKIRNLEKRKRKLEGYKSDLDKGKALTEEQLEAVQHLHEVDGHLELCRDLAKQVNDVAVETTKQKKLDERRAVKERHVSEMKNLSSIIHIQAVLTGLARAEVADDFSRGSNKAVSLTKEELKCLEEFRLLLLPDLTHANFSSASGSSLAQALDSASSHAHCLITASNKKVLNTTYKDLKCLIDKVLNCGYFEKDSRAPSPPNEDESDRSTSVTDTPVDANEEEHKEAEWNQANVSGNNTSNALPASAEQRPNQQLNLEFMQPDQSSFRLHTFAVVNDTTTTMHVTDENTVPPKTEPLAVPEATDLSAPQPPVDENHANAKENWHDRNASADGGGKMTGRNNTSVYRPRGRGGSRPFFNRNGSGKGCYNCGGDHFVRECQEPPKDNYSSGYEQRDGYARGGMGGYRGGGGGVRGGGQARGRGYGRGGGGGYAPRQ